jgi:hypothetical protein
MCIYQRSEDWSWSLKEGPLLLVVRGIPGDMFLGFGCGLVRFLCSTIFDILTFIYSPGIPCRIRLQV